MKYQRLGNSDIEISSIGLGCMGMSEFYGQSDDSQSIRVIHHALEMDLNFLDTADTYGLGRNEELVRKAIKGKRDQVVLATKFGIVREEGKYERRIDGRPEYVKEACENSLRRLGTDVIDLYYAHRINPEIPVEETMGAMADLVEQGKVRALGLSEVSLDTLKKANAVHPISALQSEYSMTTREVEALILPGCKSLGITFVAYSPICRGLLSSDQKKFDEFQSTDFRQYLPRFQEENLRRNRLLVEALESTAKDKNCTIAQLSLAWLLAQGDHIVPIPGTRRIEYLEENIASLAIVLNQNEVTELTKILDQNPVYGNRYTEEGMKGVNV
jgi:aryl-alcohol dehydrogenase-like predicted oxidoreductase